MSPRNCCRICGATNYRHVVERDATGVMRRTGLYRCSGCSAVFADPRLWRGEQPVQPAPKPSPSPLPLPAPRPGEIPAPPDLTIYMQGLNKR
jgi:hypothetical protein